MNTISRKELNLAEKKKLLLKQLLQKETAAQRDAQAEEQAVVLARPDRQRYPLLLTQLQSWKLEQFRPGEALLTALRLEYVDEAALAQSLRTLVERHEILRACFSNQDGQPVQHIAPSIHSPISQVDLSSVALAERDRVLEHLLDPTQQQPFEISQGPLFRTSLVRLDTATALLLLAVHPLLADHATLALLGDEWWQLYQEATTGQQAHLPALELTCADYAHWQQHSMQETTRKALLHYWKQQLAGATLTLNLPLDYPRPALQTKQPCEITRVLDADLMAQARAFCARAHISLETCCFALCVLLLQRYSGQTDIVLGRTSTGRPRGLEQVAGPCATMQPVRIQFREPLSALAFLQQVQKTLLAAERSQGLPLAQIVEAVYPDHDLTREPLFQVSFAWQQVSSTHALPLRPTLAMQDLAFLFQQSDGPCTFTVCYDGHIFAPATIERLHGHIVQLLLSMLEQPEAPVEKLVYLTPAEQVQILYRWNETLLAAPPVPTLCLHHLFEQQVERSPHAVAVSDGQHSLTYDELNGRANQLARLLRKQGVGPEQCVGLCLTRSLHLIIGQLAILKAGAAYVPLDPTYPRERLEFTIQDAGLKIILTEQALVTQMPFTSEQALCVDIPGLYEQESADNLHGEMHSAQLAYIIYTSGSTGRPKGVCICHRNAVIFLHWARQEFSDEELAGVLFGTSICFDLSIFEVFAPLSWGGRVILAHTVLDLPQLATCEHITLLNTVPSAATALLHTGGLPSSLLTINLAGEALARDLVQALYQNTSVRRVCNLYGPTEDTTYSTGATIKDRETGAVTIGRPLANTRAYIVDASMQPVPVGVAGELYLGGDGQARGYLNRPDLTAERFVPDPFSPLPGSRLYKTGDLARYRVDGSIDYLGRLDHQVKVRGFRIELGEIEAHLRQHPTVADVVVVATEITPGEKHLVAYVVAQPQQTCDIAQLRLYLQDCVPAYMVPTFFLLLPALPQTVNGKVDRKALPVPHISRVTGHSSPHALPPEVREQLLADCWQEMLHVEGLDRNAHFFQHGGNSWLVERLILRLQQDLSVALTPDDVFAAPTIAQLAEQLLRVPIALPTDVCIAQHEPARCSPETVLPLLGEQTYLWMNQQLESGIAQGSVPLLLSLSGNVQTLALYQTLRALLHRHDILRSIIRMVNGSPALLLSEQVEPDFAVLDLTVALREHASQDAQTLTTDPLVLAALHQEIERPFDLASGPLLRTRLLRLRSDQHILLLNTHQVIIDHWSYHLLLEEISALYTAFSQGYPSPLTTPATRIGACILWQKEQQAAHLAANLAYWQECFTPPPPTLSLPCDYPRPFVRTSAGATKYFQLDQALRQQLLAQSQQEGITLYTTLLTAYLLLLAHQSGQTDLVVGTQMANRTQPALAALAGCFASTLPLRADLSGNPSGRILRQRVAALVQDASSHQDVPFAELLKALQVAQDPSRTPLFQVVFLLQSALTTSLTLPGLDIEAIELTPGVSSCDLAFLLEEHPQGLHLKIAYATSLFAEATIEQLARRYQLLLTLLYEHPEMSLQDIMQLLPQQDTWKHWTAERPPCQAEGVSSKPNATSRQHIAPEEIEQALQQQAGVQRIVVIALEDAPESAKLCAYIQPQPATRLDISLLRLALKKRFTSPLPITIRVVEHFPLHTNGEIDRARLARPERASDASPTSPRMALEYAITRIWQRVLKLALIERTENFFELGGHSLLAMQVLAAFREELHIVLSTRQFFAAPTIASLAELIEAGTGASGQPDEQNALPALVPMERSGALPLSFAQQRLWFLDQLEGSSATYNIPIVLRLTGALHIAVLQSSIREIVRRHEALRTTFPKGQDMPAQCIQQFPFTQIEQIDCSTSTWDTILQDIQATIQRPFNLATGPLLRTRVLRLGSDEHILIFVMHHIISDGWSMAVLAQELNTLYNAFIEGRPSPLPELAIQYGDFVIWQRQYLQGKRLAAHLDYWKTHLHKIPTLALPTDRPRTAGHASPGACCDVQWPQDFAQALQAFSQREDVTLFMTLLAAFQILLACYSGQDDITVGSPVANRSHPALEPLVGFFVNTLALRTNLAHNPSVREILERVREVTLGAYDHQDIPFEQVVEAVQPERQPGITPLFQVFFVLQNNATTELTLANIQAQAMDMHTATAKFDLAMSLETNAQGLHLSIEYNTNLFERSTIERMQEHYRLLLTECLANPQIRLADLSGLLAREIPGKDR